MAGPVVGVDWGGSNLRAFRFAPDGRVLETRAAPLGVGTLKDGGFEAALAGVIGDWKPQGGELRILVCGMAGARGGWLEAPYAACPADLAAVAGQMVCFQTGLGQVCIAPGLSTCAPNGRHDVMRGEETQIFGAIDAPGPVTVITPGTHSKWCQVTGGRVIGFQTHMTGELFAVLADHSILGRLMDGRAPDAGAFALGVTRALETPHTLSLLFGVRSEALFGEIASQATGAYLSGLLIGAEVRAGLAEAPAGGAICVIGAEGLTERYRAALALAGAPDPEIIDGAFASAQGLWRLATVEA